MKYLFKSVCIYAHLFAWYSGNLETGYSCCNNCHKSSTSFYRWIIITAFEGATYSSKNANKVTATENFSKLTGSNLTPSRLATPANRTDSVIGLPVRFFNTLINGKIMLTKCWEICYHSKWNTDKGSWWKLNHHKIMIKDNNESMWLIIYRKII